MNQDPIVASTRESAARKPEIDRAGRRIPECQPGEQAVALDRVRRARDGVPHIIEWRSQRLANAAVVVAVAAAAGMARDQGGAQQTLSVDDLVIAARAQRPPERRNLA